MCIDSLCLEINLYFKTAEINVQIFIDTGLDGICEGILLGIAGIEVINQDQIFGRINNPVFPDASRAEIRWCLREGGAI